MKTIWKIVSYVLVAALASTMTLYLCVQKPETSKLDELSELISEKFIGEADKTQYEDAAAEAMVDALGDRWSYYIPANQYQSHVEQMENAYVGIGVTIAVRENGGFEITKVNVGGPAEEAGIQPGDVIVAVEGQPCEEMTTEEVRNLVRGEENTAVLLTLLREEQTLDVSVLRKQVLTPVATAQMLEQNVGLITISNFDDRCADESVAAIEQLREQGAQSLIFDVRNNPGGYKHELVALLDYLLPEGPLFRSEDYLGNVAVDESDEKYLDMPMAVLVNADSYSAAEFFAAALREYDAAFVVGEQTCGKGYFQSTFQFSDGSAVGLSIGKYTTPKGVSLAGVGITPDIIVEVDEETAYGIYAQTLAPEEDPQIQAAVEELSKP